MENLKTSSESTLGKKLALMVDEINKEEKYATEIKDEVEKCVKKLNKDIFETECKIELCADFPYVYLHAYTIAAPNNTTQLITHCIDTLFVDTLRESLTFKYDSKRIPLKNKFDILYALQNFIIQKNNIKKIMGLKLL